MKCLLRVSLALLLIQLMYCNTGQAAPHTSAEESDGHVTKQGGGSAMTPGSDHGSHEHQTSHETKSKEQDDDESRSSEETESVVQPSAPEEEDKDESNEDEPVRFPKTESLCPARPEEITNIEAECAEEYRKWKRMRALKTEVTTCHTTARSPEVTEGPSDSGEDMTPVEPQQLDEMTTIMMDTEEATTDTSVEVTTTITTTSTTPLPTTTRPVQRRSSKHKRSRKIIKKRSCYPATCILRKLNLLDGMGQPSIERIQTFAVNMTVDDSTNLEQKAVGCVKEINEAMIDASTDIGKKVGCVAQKVISCLNKGLTCPIMNVPQ